MYQRKVKRRRFTLLVTFSEVNWRSKSFPKIFLLVVGHGDVTYNSKRGILGAISSELKTAYHLFDINPSASNPEEIVKLARPAKWPLQLGGSRGNLDIFLFFSR